MTRYSTWRRATDWVCSRTDICGYMGDVFTREIEQSVLPAESDRS